MGDKTGVCPATRVIEAGARPCGAMLVAVLGFNPPGDALRDALDPRLRGQV